MHPGAQMGGMNQMTPRAPMGGLSPTPAMGMSHMAPRAPMGNLSPAPPMGGMNQMGCMNRMAPAAPMGLSQMTPTMPMGMSQMTPTTPMAGMNHTAPMGGMGQMTPAPAMGIVSAAPAMGMGQVNPMTGQMQMAQVAMGQMAMAQMAMGQMQVGMSMGMGIAPAAQSMAMGHMAATPATSSLAPAPAGTVGTRSPIIIPKPRLSPLEMPLSAEAEARREKVLAAARLRESVEKNEGYIEPRLGDKITSAEGDVYTVVDKSPLGVGVFSVVWPCADKHNKLVALKVVRHQDHFRQYAEKEVQTLQRVRSLAEQDPEGAAQVALLREHFIHKCVSAGTAVEHLCMCFEKLESNLRTIGRQPLEKALCFSKQLLLALRFLHEQAQIVHCDVKPDNLLLRWDGQAVKLCDFGTARTSPELQAVDELQPLFYRAPEVFLGFTRGRKIDIWSAGLTIYEIFVGRILFRSCNTAREVVEEIQKHFGPLPLEMRQHGRLKTHYFTAKGFHPEVGNPVDPDATYKKKSLHSELVAFADFGKESAKTAHEQAKAQLMRLIGGATVIGGATKRSGGQSEGEKRLKLLADLVDKCMDVDPSTRITAAVACDHDVLKGVDLPPMVDLQEAPPLPEEAPPPLPPDAPEPPPEPSQNEPPPPPPS